MFEATTDRRIRNAYDAAHKARSAALRDMWSWMIGR